MRHAYAFFALLAAVTLSACATSNFTRATEAEREWTATDTHPQTKAEAYTRLRRWAAQTYNSANDVLQMQDPESGTLVVKGATGVSRPMTLVSIPIGYTLTMDIRDQRIRFTGRVGEPMEGDAGRTMSKDAEQVRAEFERIRASALAVLSGAGDDF